MRRRVLSALVAGSALLLLGACGAAQDSGAQDSGVAVDATTVPNSSPLTSVPLPPEGDKPTGKPAPSDIGPPMEGTPPTEGLVPADYTELAADRLDTRALPPEYKQRRAWVSPDGLSLRVLGVARDGCAGVQGKATESGTAVQVLLTQMTAPQGGAPDVICTQVLTEKVVTVPLSTPLASRTVVLQASD